MYTTTNPHGDAENAMATRVPLPMDERNAKLLRLKGAYGSTEQAGSGAPAVWKASLFPHRKRLDVTVGRPR